MKWRKKNMEDKNKFSLEEHHIHPKFMDNKKGNGDTYSITKNEHIKLHLIIPTILWKYIPQEEKQKCINEVIEFSKKFISSSKKNNNKSLLSLDTDDTGIKFCFNCGAELDIEDILCEYCSTYQNYENSGNLWK